MMAARFGVGLGSVTSGICCPVATGAVGVRCLRVARSIIAPVGGWCVMTSSVLRVVARHPVVAFMVIGLGAAFLVVVIPPIVDAQILPFDLPLYGVVGGVLGVGVGAFFVTHALSGRAGVADLARRSVRWRVPLRRYLIALLAVPVGATLISLAIYGTDAQRHRPGAGRERWPRSPPSSCSSSCCSRWPRRSASPGSSSITGRTGTTR